MTNDAQNKPVDDLTKLRRSSQAEAFWQTAQRYLLEGRHAQALASYRNLVQQFPGVSQLWAELGLAAAGDLDFPLANQASDRATELAFADPPLLVSLGQQYHRLGRPEQACACFQRAVLVDPVSVHARLSLASWLERDRRSTKPGNVSKPAWPNIPMTVGRSISRRFYCIARGSTGTPKPPCATSSKPIRWMRMSKYSAHHLLGVVLDALGRYAEAIDWLGKAKALLRQTANPTALEGAYDQMDRARRKLLAELTPETLRRWNDEAAEAVCPYPSRCWRGCRTPARVRLNKFSPPIRRSTSSTRRNLSRKSC